MSNMEDAIRLLQTEAEKQKIVLTEKQLCMFSLYGKELTEWNEKMNLTAITEPNEIAIRHFLDSVLPAHYVDLPQEASLVDVGTGAGFPGIPLAILRPDLKITLLDSLNKRLIFLQDVCEKLQLPLQLVHSRAEDGGRNSQMRERFDVATARAVAALPVLSEYCIPFVKVGGFFLAMKGPDCKEEIKASEKAISLLGGKIEKTYEYSLPDGSGRTLILIRKISATANKYPRNSGKIAKTPL